MPLDKTYYDEHALHFIKVWESRLETIYEILFTGMYLLKQDIISLYQLSNRQVMKLIKLAIKQKEQENEFIESKTKNYSQSSSSSSNIAFPVVNDELLY